MRFSISATTRPPRPGEQEGRDYFFKSRREFEAMVAAGEMLEHAEVFGNLYGTPRAPVEAAIADGQDVLFDVDWQGGQQIRNSSLRDAVVSIFILPPSIAELESRLRAAGQDAPSVVAEPDGEVAGRDQPLGRIRLRADQRASWRSARRSCGRSSRRAAAPRPPAGPRGDWCAG